jgi:hypothetical protein
MLSGKEVGATPYAVTDDPWIWQSSTFQVVQDGKSVDVEIKRSEFDVVPGIASICLLPVCCSGVVLFLAGGLKFPDEVKVDMAKAPASKPPLAPAPTPAPGG